MNIYLVRHTPVVLDSSRTCYGWSDVELSADFEAHLADLRERARGMWQDPLIFSSPLQRCMRLARALGSSEAAVQADDRLKELNFGDWEGKLWDEIPRDALDAWGADYVEHRLPGGESYRDLLERVQSFRADRIDRMVHMKEGDQRDILIVSHGGVLRALLAGALKIAPADAFVLEIPHGSISCIALKGDLTRVRFINR